MLVSLLRGISLANKCLLLFGGAIVLIVALAMIAPWLRMDAIAKQEQIARSRELASLWMATNGSTGEPSQTTDQATTIQILTLTQSEMAQRAEADRTVRRAARSLDRDEALGDVQVAGWDGLSRRFIYVRRLARGGSNAAPRLLLLSRSSVDAGWQMVVNTIYLLSASAFVLGLALLVFYQITHKIILAPVRDLRTTAERVRGGDINVRSQIVTGDEFQELSETFNAMLAALQSVQDKLHTQNSALDLKVSELAQHNSTLFESNKMKAEFLANVSHELRTPMNAIIGFAELLLEITTQEREQLTPGAEDTRKIVKRERYIGNIVESARNLLELINGLLDMAKIEAGKVELALEWTALPEMCEGLLGLVYPLAHRSSVDVRLELSKEVPLVRTDRQKLQQIVFNLLSNAVKFTGVSQTTAQPTVILRVEPIAGAQNETQHDHVRVSIIDNGPGIAKEDQARIFEKFQQVDGSHTREHAGTGLGLAISKELARVIQGEIQLISEPGRGSMFSVIIPVHMDENTTRERALESSFRASPSGRTNKADDGDTEWSRIHGQTSSDAV